MPEQGWKIPKHLFQFNEIILSTIQSEKRFGNFEKDHYVYITVDQKTVQKGNTGRRAGAHSDAYLEDNGAQVDLTHESHGIIASQTGEVSHTYIAYSSLPTEFFGVPFPLVDTTDEGSLQTFDEIADKAPVIVYPTFTVLRLDPYVVHRCAVAETTHRKTFVKVSISRRRFARIGNTINPEFKYDWEMDARSPDKRNSPWKD